MHIIPVYRDDRKGWTLAGYRHENESGAVVIPPEFQKVIEKAPIGVLNGLVPFSDLLFLATGRGMDYWESVTNFNN